MPDIQDNTNIADRILNEKYEMYVLYVDDDAEKLRPMQSVVVTADGIVEKAANGTAKIKLRNVIIDTEATLHVSQHTEKILSSEDIKEKRRKEFLELIKPRKRKVAD